MGLYVAAPPPMQEHPGNAAYTSLRRMLGTGAAVLKFGLQDPEVPSFAEDNEGFPSGHFLIVVNDGLPEFMGLDLASLIVPCRVPV